MQSLGGLGPRVGVPGPQLCSAWAAEGFQNTTSSSMALGRGGSQHG